MRFGLYPENEKISRYWGARVIFTNQRIDIPYDKKSFEGEPIGSEDFIQWINKEFFPVLEHNKSSLYHDQSKHFYHSSEDDRFYGHACCNSSHGYLYIGCWELKTNY